ncbi:tRNA threonylcarbamoyladenosine dehydratase isoform X2 [Triticum aestivum]|uniref:tRNA threonylcarbamoyladenosine dehydratase isoform X2 n=1 Tax=Triticum aestivum TaxID=4565 RepID=UPI001D0249B1|nr:tRNA threonylcarbamoyladenosine dehydratase-like isoform X2 [Triticum aestivum]
MEERARQLLLLAAVAGVGAAFGALSTAAVFSFLSRAKRREGYVRKLLESNGGAGGPHAGKTAPGARLHDSSDLLSDEVVAEQLTRNIQFFGVESQKKVTESFVVVIGLGGVGSHAASMLLRSGVGRLLLVDFDQVSLSSLNRHAVATREDVGTPKAYCLKKHFSLIYPECQIEARVQLYDSSAEDEILSGQPDFVLDCIDNIDTKVRYRLKKDHGIEGGIPVVFSMEKPKAKLLPFQGSKEEETPSDYQIVPGFRVRIIPVLGTIPAIFGQVMASYVVTQLAQLDFQTEPIVNLDLDHYRILHHRLLEHEELIYGSAEQVLVDAEEVMYIVKELWRGRSARDQNMKDTGWKMWRSVNELMLVRWDKSKPAGVSNLILLKFSEADAHESTTLDQIKDEEPEFYAMVSRVLKRAETEFAL